MADEVEWMLFEDGCLCINESICGITYHPTLNVILISTKESTFKVLDVYSGLILQNSQICASSKSQVQCVYIPVHDKLLFTDGKSVGLRRDHNGVLLLDTILQTRIGTASDVVRIELLLSEAIHLLKSLKDLEVLSSEQTDEVRRELESKVAQKEAQSKFNHKVAKWSTVCLELPHNVLKSVCGALVQEFRRLNRYVPTLSIASAVGERLSSLVPPLATPDALPLPAGTSALAAVDRSLMFSEAARRETFGKWPHMNYKWALPDQMAQAGFYHQSNSSGDDRAMCFTCNICLVCWEPTDEPWSEHERHSPSCPFVKGEYTQNVPLSVTQASGPAFSHSDRMEAFTCVSTSSFPDLMATATENGNIVVWNVVKSLKKEFQFTIDLREAAIVCATESRRRRIVDLMENDNEQSDAGIGRNSLSKNGVKLKRSNLDGATKVHCGSIDALNVTALSVVSSVEAYCSSEEVAKCGGMNKPPSLVVGCSIRRSLSRFYGAGRCVVEDNPLVQAKNDVNQAGCAPRSLDIMCLEDEVKEDGDIDDVCAPSSLSAAATASGLYLLIYSLGSRRLPRVVTGCVGAEASVRRTSGTRQDNGGCLFNMTLGALLDDSILVDPYGLNPFGSTPSIPNASDIQFGVSCPVHQASSEENGTLEFPDNGDGIVDSVPMRNIKVDVKECQFGVRLVCCLEICGDFCGETHSVAHVVPTSDYQHVLVVIGRTEAAMCDSDAVGCLFLFRLTSAGDYATLEDAPILTRTLGEAISRVVMLPSEVIEGRDDSPSASKLTKSTACVTSLGYAAVITSCGCVEIIKLSTLDTVGKMEPPTGDSFVALAYCTSMERLCCSTSKGQLLLLQLWPKVKDNALPSEVGGRNPPASVDGGEQAPYVYSNVSSNPKDHDVGHLLVDRALTANVLTSLHELAQFANLMPRFAATLPTCWTEIQQEQKQRRHPQHLQQQGEGQQYTRSWRLQCDNSTWDEHLLELTLPKPCSVGHIDLKFNLQPVYPSPPNIQVTLLKQNTCGICKVQDFTLSSNGDANSPVDKGEAGAGVNELFSGRERKNAVNPVVLPEFLEAHNAEILCGPLSLETRIDLSGQSGIVTFTSPELFKTKARTFLIHMKSLDDDKERQERAGECAARCSANLSKSGGRLSNIKMKDRHGPVPSLQTLLEHTFQENMPPKSATEILAATAPGRKIDVPRGCNVLYEISLTVRTSKKCPNLGNEREQRVAMLESVSFQERLVALLCGGECASTDITLEHRQHLVLDILNWIASIQANGVVLRTDVKISVFVIIQSNLDALINACFLTGSRSVAHKASKLIVLCTEFYRSIKDQCLELSLMRSLLKSLPMVVACHSAGAMHWFFLLLNSIKFLDSTSVGHKCLSLLVSIVEELDRRSHPMHGLLRARFGLYRNAFELELYEVEATQPPKPTSTPITYAAVVGNGGSASASNNNNNNNGTGGGGMGIGSSSSGQTTAGCQSSTFGFGGATFLSEDGPGTPTPFNHPAQQLQGLLEVEPLHFVCNSASDGTKVEKVDQSQGFVVNPSSMANNNMTVYVPTAHDSSQISNVLKDMKKTEEELLKVLQQKQSIILQQSSLSAPDGTLPQSSSTAPGTASISMPAPAFTSSKQSPSTPINGLSAFPTCFQHFLQPPPQQVLVIERMHSGARRFVVLDFGKPVVLTDLIIPACPDLVSLSIDIWTKGEEEDGRRLVVSTDIFFRSLVMSDLLPPPVCRYLKITAIGRYGMSTTRCRIPLGSFYGLTTLPPWVVADDGDQGLSDGELRHQLNMLSTFLEDVHCRYSLACDKLRSLLTPLLSYNRSTAGHIQAFVRGEREGTSGDEQRIYTAYRDCVQMQQQFSLISSTAERLQRWRTVPSASPVSASSDPRQACTDKLGVLGECLLVTLLGMTFKSAQPAGLDCPSSGPVLPFLDESMCKLLFRHLATAGSRRFQAMATALLVRTCGLCPWWGDFVAQMFVELYSSNQTAIFPQDRVFLLLVSRHDKSLLWNTMPSILELLEKLLSPILDPANRSFGSVDLPLVGWVLLFISFYLDLADGGGSSGYVSEDSASGAAVRSSSASKDKEGVSSRWDFIQEEWALLRNQSNQTKMASSRFYRKKLQKRLMYHKQQLEDLEQTKKEFIPSATFSMLKCHFGAKVAVDLNAAIKQQEQLFKKMLKQHTTKHFKDVVQIRRMEGGNLSRFAGDGSSGSGGSVSGPSWEQDDGVDLKEPPLPLHRTQSLKVARGLSALLLCMDYTCNVDMFLLSCKILARIATLARPAIGLGEILSQSELQKLLWRSIGYQRAAGTPSWGGPWAGHAITCLLQDILEGERMFPIVGGGVRASTSAVGCSGISRGSTVDTTGPVASALIASDLLDIPQNSPADDASAQFEGENNLVGLEKLLEVESDETSSDETPVDCNESTPKYLFAKKVSADTNKPSYYKNGGSSSLNALQDGLISVPCGANVGKISVSTVSSAIDSRLEMGVEVVAELRLKTMAFSESDAFFGALFFPLPPPTDQPLQYQAMRNDVNASPFATSFASAPAMSSSADMLCMCFDNLFWQAKMPGVSLESLLQLWVSLNNETSSDPTAQILPLSANAASGLLDALAWYPTLSLRTWYLAFKVLVPFGGHQSTNAEIPSHSSSDSSAKAIASSDVLLPVIVKFLSGTGLEYVSGTKLNVGPNVSGVMCDFLSRLMKNCHTLPSGFRAGVHLKEQLLRIVYLLLANNGTLRCGQGPLDAQCRFVNLLLTVHFDGVDPHIQTSIVEAVASLVHFHVHTGRQVTCRSSTESSVGDGTCFGGLFSVPLRNDLAGCSMEGTRSNLIHSLLSLCVRLVQTPCGKSPVADRLSSFLTDTFKMEQRSSMSTSSCGGGPSSSEPLQTDELKSSCPQVPICGHTHALSPCPKPLFVAEAVLQHQPTMLFLLSTLASCTGSTMAMILGPVSIGSSNTQQDGTDRFVLGEPASVGDVVFQLLVTLNSKALELSSILRPVLAFLSCESVELDGRPKTSVTLSEPLLWLLIKILDCKHSLAEFFSLGGVEVVCRNLVSSYSTQVNCHPSLLSVIMQKMNRLMAPSVKGQWPNSDNVDGLVNFAPLGTITSKDPTTMQPADVLIQPTPPHRRARTPAWSYHFYPEDSWVELTITLPCAILLHEVHIQPHLTSLATCPSAVSLEVSADGFSRPKPLCPSHPTGGLTFIRLQLSRPEVTTSMMIRLYKPRDSSNLGLSQILLLGSSAFGEAATHSSSLIVPTEESVAKSCIGWMRILHHCLVHQCDMDVLANMCQVAASVPGLLHTCCSLLTSPAPELYATHVESVLLTLGRHNARVGLQVINILLHTGGSPFRQGNCSWLMDRSQGGWSSVDSVTDIIHLLCTTKDSNMIERIRALINWLQLTTRAAIQHFKSQSSIDQGGSIPKEFGGVPTQAFVHCVAVTLWSLREAGFATELEPMLDIDLFRSLYDWSARLSSTSSTKWAVDAVLTSICHVCPHFFPLLLEWMGFSVPPASREEAPITDDSKKEITINQAGSSPDHSLRCCEMIDLNSIPTECLATVAAASQSFFVIEQLIRSRLPTTLAQAILDFCIYIGTAIGSRSSFDNNTSFVDHMTDSDKAGRSCNSSSSGVGVVVTGDVVTSILNFFTEVCGEGTMRDWLGGPEGSIFWHPLVDLLCQPLSRLSGPSCQQTFGLTAQLRASLEAATIQFLSRCCWCHSDNQQLLAQVLCKVIGKQGSAGNQGGLSGLPSISGFARRLILQLLLENEKILVCVKSSLPLNGQLLSGCHWRHPRFGCGHRYRLLYASTQMTCSDLIASASSDSTASMSIMAESGEAAEAPRDDLGSIGLDLADYLSVAAGVLAKDKRHKETKGTNHGLVFHPSARSGRHSLSATGSFSSLPLSTMALVHEMFPDHPLPSDMTLAQLLSALEDKGQSLLSPHVILTLQSQSQSKGPTDAAYSEPGQGVADFSKLLMGYTGFPSVLQVFASVGGLALMAQYLPILYPDANRVSLASSVAKASTCEDKMASLCDVASNLEADWVKVEGPDDMLDDFPELVPLGNSSSRSLHATSMPPHSLAAFGLFLRLPGYAETLLRERQRALCLLRLALGVCDDGEGGDIFSSSVAPSLPTLPFQVLQRLFDSTPLTTDDGLLLRRMALDVGAIHLLLACLSILSHQNVDVSLSTAQHEAMLAATRGGVAPLESQPKSDDKSHLYWAKGTGFGTGSTAQSWDVEQAITRQKSEEEHVTCLLLVLASFINPGGHIPDVFSGCGTDCDDNEIWLDEDDDETKTSDSQPTLLPAVFPELLAQSCLFASISSYLRNDSVLDMARHVPLYRALLLLLRALAVCNQLVGLLLPRLGRKSESDASANMSVCCLLTKMKSCVDTYASRLRVNNKSKSQSRGGGGLGGNSGLGVGKSLSRFSSKTREEEEESEGLALLIPDIQETARIVKLATERLIEDSVEATDDDGGALDRVDGLSIDRRFQKSIEDRYIEAMRRLQFDTFEMIVEDEDGTRFTIPHHFESNMRAAGDHGHPSRARRLAQETVTLSTSLPLSYSSSVFVRCDQDRLDLMKVLITGPAETPYANGCFEFDVYFPPDYPNSPMLINLETTGHHTVRFNPNLYNDGKVCLSILNTWHGRPEEKWNSQTSSFLQVLVSIQSLILVQEPYFNEPGYERSRVTPSGQQSSREYDSNIRQATVKWAMLEQLRNPCPSFREVVRQHFWMKRSEISEQCETWISEMEAQGRDRRTGRTVALNCQALKRHYALLKEEFSRMKPPSGLEDIAANVGWAKPPSPEDGGGATALGGSSGADVLIAEFAQLVDKIDDSDSTSSSQENGNATIHHPSSQGPTASSYFCEPV